MSPSCHIKAGQDKSDWLNEQFYQQLLIMRTDFIISLLISASVVFLRLLNQARCSVTKISNYLLI